MRGDLIPRPQLLKTLQEAVSSHKLILISAPAGYGKTTLLTTLINTHPDLSIAWLSLDEGDNDLALFLPYLGTALHALDPMMEIAPPTFPGLTDASNYARRGIGSLINAIQHAVSTPSVLILDDLHLLTEASIYIALDYFLERLPPQMHLIIATRQDPPLPLSRLRARGQLAEFRLADLRFTPEETTTFLNATLRLELSPDDLSALHTCTEGWAAGLRLLTTPLNPLTASGDRATFIVQLAHTQRYISDFLAEEVLNRQDEMMRAFLLETSILPELSIPLCRAVTGQENIRQILSELDRRNLLSCSVDENRIVWRYHDFFTEFLRERLKEEMPQRLLELRRRAAEAETHPDRAIAHYLAAEMWAEAARGIEQIGDALLAQGLFITLSHWINALPAPVYKASPQLLYLLGASIWHRENLAAGQTHLEDALRGFEALNDTAGQGKVLSILSHCTLIQGDTERSRTLMARALDYSPTPPTRLQLLVGHAWLSLLTGDSAQTAADLETAWAVTQAGHDPELLHQLVFYSTPAFVVLPEGLAYLERLYRQAAAAGIVGQNPLAQLMLDNIHAFVCLRRGQFEQGIQAGESGLALNEQWGRQPLIEADLLFTLISIYAARGEYEMADRHIRWLTRQVNLTALDPTFVRLHRYLLGRAYWLQKRIPEARQVYAEMEAAPADTLAAPHREQDERLNTEGPMAAILRLMLRGLLAISEENYAAAEQDFREAALIKQPAPFSDLVGSPRLLLAYLYRQTSRPEDALAELTPILVRSQQQQIPALILQEGAIALPLLQLAVERGVYAAYAAQLLETLEIPPPARPLYIPHTGETLTPREVEILQLIAAGASNRALAEQLVISRHTVKTHVSHILQKFGVSSRGQAAAHFRRLQDDRR